jgi:hypothetical protein
MGHDLPKEAWSEIIDAISNHTLHANAQFKYTLVDET